MKKLKRGLSVVAVGLTSLVSLAGCSSEAPTPTGTSGSGMGGSAAGGSPAMGGSTTGGVTGTQLMAPAYYAGLSDADAPANPTAPPATWGAQCALCHGSQGQGFDVGGGILLGPEIRHVPPAYANYTVRNGRIGADGKPSGMAAFNTTTVPDADLMAIITWLDTAPKPTTGALLYKDFCGTCHGPTTPTGGGVPVSIQGKSKTDVGTKVRQGFGTDMSKRNEYMPAFDTTLLSETELGLIEAYIGAQ